MVTSFVSLVKAEHETGQDKIRHFGTEVRQGAGADRNDWSMAGFLTTGH